ncbi:MAG: hypothetical protein JWN96_4188 [Mycobacterium sp.]|jgi:hypothetical protein|nr:hypothetical protein [Mycobacterium sp.]
MMIGQETAGSQVQVQRELKRVVLWLRPDGWQARARRNAWASMVADRQRRQERMIAGRESQGLVRPGLQAQVP